MKTDLDQLTAHPLADLFPMINKDDYPAFKLDIETNGLAEKIILLDGLILDGRNRYRVLKELGTCWNPEYYVNFEALELGMTPFDFVISKNMQRRHLNESQRAMVAARAANMRQGERTDIPDDAPLNEAAPLDTTEPSAHMRKVSQGEAAEKFKVSERMVTGAKKIMDHGTEALQEKVNSGEFPVTVGEQVAKLPKSEQDRLLSEAQKPEQIRATLKKMDREKREADLAAKQQALPIKKYGVIYADPEWVFEVRSENGKDRSAENHYPCTPYEEIMRRRVQDIAADDCVLFMWATVPCLIEAVCVLNAWGFVVFTQDRVNGHMLIDKRHARYVSQWSWIKTRIANGYWGRNKHEILLIATKGRPVAPALGTQPPSVIEDLSEVERLDVAPHMDEPAVTTEAAREHSRKPEVFAEWIEKLFPNTPKIELNARRRRPGWDVWGNEAPEEEAPEIVTDHPPCEMLAKPEEAPAETGGVASAFKAEIEADEELGGFGNHMLEHEEAADEDASPDADRMPKMTNYEGKHTEATDALIRYGYRHEKSITLICAWLGLPDSKKGIVKGRANRLGLTNPERIAKNNKARAKGKKDETTE